MQFTTLEQLDAVRLEASHEALSHTQWLQQKVDAVRRGLENGSNERIAPDEWKAIRAAKRRQRDAL